MEAQQRRLKYGHQMRDLWIALPHHTHQQRQSAKQEAEGKYQQETSLHHQCEQQQTQRHELHRLVSVGQRQMSTDVPSQTEK